MSIETQPTPRDPEVVFNPEYWGDSHEPFHVRIKGLLMQPGERKKAKSIMAELAPLAIRGSVKGTTVAPGSVFCPMDDQLAASSPHNFPGALLMYDYERLLPLDKYTAETLAERSEEEDVIQRNVFDASPRTLMRRNMATDMYNTTVYGGAYVEYTNGDNLYRRKAGIAYIAHKRRGGRGILELIYGSYNPTALQDNTRILAGVSVFEAIGFKSGVVGDTQVHYDEDGEFGSAYRIRSLEILAGGQPVTAPQKSTRLSFLPHTSH